MTENIRLKTFQLFLVISVTVHVVYASRFARICDNTYFFQKSSQKNSKK